MLRCFLIFFIIFTTLPSFSFAKIDENTLQAKYGPDLNKAPFFIRFNFEKEIKKEWSASDYPERRAFLTEYETNLVKQQLNEKAEARAAAIEEKRRLREKKDELRKEQERLRVVQEKARAEQREDETRQKSFDQSVTAQQKELTEMQRQATEGN